MANTKKQRKSINKELYSHFTHPSPALKRKWDDRAKKGGGPEEADRRLKEWREEGQKLARFKQAYRQRVAAELWAKTTFQAHLRQARRTYLENENLPAVSQDESCLARVTKEILEKYALNHGWLRWVAHCVETGENNPREIDLYLIRKGRGTARHLSLEVYFPLPIEVYEEAVLYLRMAEPDAFGDYYSQEQSGGRRRKSRPASVTAKYRRMISLRNAPAWRLKTDTEFLAHYTEYNRSELSRARRWERDGKPE